MCVCEYVSVCVSMPVCECVCVCESVCVSVCFLCEWMGYECVCECVCVCLCMYVYIVVVLLTNNISDHTRTCDSAHSWSFYSVVPLGNQAINMMI